MKYLKILLTFFCIILHNYCFSKNNYVSQNDSIKDKSLDDQIEYFASDSIVYDLEKNIIMLYNEAKVNYKSIKLQAYYITINLNDNTLFAEGKLDSSLVLTQNPIFFENGKEYKSKTIKYNFKTEKGLITKLLTKEGESFLHGEIVKKEKNKTQYLSKGLYTTCNHEEPHFYIKANKVKFIEGEKFISGPANLIIEDIPTPIILPFAVFPISNKRSSGLLLPSYGNSVALGYNLKDLGYYFGINDYIDLKLTSDLFTRGSYRLGINSNYKKRYNYQGSININFSKTKIGEKFRNDFSLNNDFSIKWRHEEDPKLRPNSRFSAAVNIASSSYSQNNLYSTDYLQNSLSSNISWNKKWEEKPYNLSLNMRHSQNTLTKQVDLTIPEINFTTGRLKIIKDSKKPAIFTNLGLSYSFNSRTLLSRPDSLLFNKVNKNIRSGIKHTIPLSTSFSILNHLNISPSFNYIERWYFKKRTQEWNSNTNEIVLDTTSGFYQVRDFNLSINTSTKIYGIVDFKKSTFRHVITPSLSFSYHPDFSNEKWNIYSTVQNDSIGSENTYSYFNGSIYGIPKIGKYGNISFSLRNNLEVKLKEKENKKIKIIEDFAITGNYNIAADSINLSPIYFTLRNKISKNFDFQMSSTIDPYKINENGAKINEFLIEDGKLGRITYSNFNFNMRFANKENTNENDFHVPWNINLYYNINYRKPSTQSEIIQSLNFDGEIILTKKWNIKFRSGYDLRNKDFTFTSIDLYRDLHCWEMMFNWVPFGNRKSYNFVIRVKSDILQDLKIEKKKNIFDSNYLSNF